MYGDESGKITLKGRFFTIGTAKVSTSAYEAYDLGILKKGRDIVSINQGRRIAEAKQSVIELYEDGYTIPVVRKDVKVLGRSALGALYAGINGMWRRNYTTHPYAILATQRPLF